ncbi:MAG: glycosyl transferase, group 2 family protein [Bacteroidetes bacterium]|nr:glycosyl transferase, group 2 family protein [Bacteroidota bacterium]
MKSKTKTDLSLVVIPTYNEAENLPRLVPAILDEDKTFHVLIVDDHSPDGTAAIVKKLQKKSKRVHLIERPGKLGLGTAYVAGFKYALKRDFEFVFEMDADFSHSPKALKDLRKKAEEYDLVIGSRYVSGVNVVNWPMKRLLLSYGANVYTRVVTGMPVRDATSGFKCYRRRVLEKMDLDSIKSEGYSFQIETNFLAWRNGFRVCEVPIVFFDRRVGVSKMSKGIVYEAAWRVWTLKFQSLFDGK